MLERKMLIMKFENTFIIYIGVRFESFSNRRVGKMIPSHGSKTPIRQLNQC